MKKDVSAAAPGFRERPLGRLVVEFCESKLAIIALAAVGTIILIALLAPFLAPQDPYDLAQLDIM